MSRWFHPTAAIAASALVASLSLPMLVRAEPTVTHEALGVTFESPSGFSEVQALARDTVGIVYPSDLDPQMVIRFAEIERDPESWVQMSPQEMMGYAKYLFTGNNAPAQEYSQREFFGAPLTGEAQTQRTRNGYRYTELYLVPLAQSDRTLAIAFESDTRLPLQTVETAIKTVTQSLREQQKPRQKKQKPAAKQSYIERAKGF
ncbi:hypothetical protein [Lyngbya confervoides]|uniref:Uncharacterized protein n=1 Tax=Lyngbya confervoides BDU141951 TaxID=1574623 RepID=A0ABD4SYS7_9CYAN|nr:hypothetical protein [Lyngbya confervoides]MCM1981296.1 hypothetical protein [Lyngbya confervoides BDU141951]